MVFDMLCEDFPAGKDQEYLKSNEDGFLKTTVNGYALLSFIIDDADIEVYIGGFKCTISI